MREAKTHLSRLVDRAANGEEIVIARRGKPVARLMPIHSESTPRPFGLMHGQITVADDFDAPLPPEVLLEFQSAAYLLSGTPIEAKEPGPPL
jgi:prevent-host-death family protein